uniref:RNA helicase n=1 Tax=Sparus aurata TaxID=8175 RepID=A0A671WXY4_SPAAU
RLMMGRECNSHTIEVHFHCSQVGCYAALLAFEFKPHHSTDAFYIVRSIEFRCRTALGQELGPTSPFKPPSFTARPPEVDCEIKDGQRPERYHCSPNTLQIQANVKCPVCPKCNPLTYLVSLKNIDTKDISKNVLKKPLNWERYSEKFHLLLYLEEQQMKKDIKRYNIPNDDRAEATMTRDQFNKKLLVLELPGVAENRPSVLRGDVLLVCLLGEKKKYRGYVHSVQLNSVHLSFHQDKLFDPKLERNPEQYRAVQHIVAGSSKPAPYLVFGPPGTGKTVTLAEAIKQIVMTQASCHILACAPTNSAADQLCEKILEFKPYRMFAQSLESKNVPDILKAFSNLDGKWNLPTKAELMEHRIIVTTLYTAGRLVTSGIPKGHFTHIFVDEAGNALETECLIPLAGLLCTESGQVVLAGDPKQLGPIVRSSLAKEYGMGVSLLERLMNDFPLYSKNEKGEFNNRFVTKLLKNYRSHPAILKVPSELFYDGELEVCAKENSFCSWEPLPMQGFPVIFHGVNGVDEREGSSPSFFNVTEVEVLMDYVEKLLQKQAKKVQPAVSPSDIGIIAPYRKQVQKIRKALHIVGKNLKLRDVSDLKVGTVEEFQGQERRVIMVSTVRSRPDYTELDKEFNLGFIKNEKRFNVAVTRAKALLIVVGNPTMLNTDETWKKFIQYCKDEGGSTGFTPAEDDEDMVMRLFALLKAKGDKHIFIFINPLKISNFNLLILKFCFCLNATPCYLLQILDPEWRSDP